MTTRAPEIGVRIWTHKDYTPWWPARAAEQEYDLSAYLVSMQTDKQLDSPTGQWNITLRVPAGWMALERLQDDDWVLLSARDRLGRHEPEALMWGVVDAVRQRKTTSSSTGATAVDLVINGRDFGKPFVTDEIITNEYLRFAAEDIPGLVDPREYSSLNDLSVQGTSLPVQELAYRLMGAIIDTNWRTLPAGAGRGSLADSLALEFADVPGNQIRWDQFQPMGRQTLDRHLRALFDTPFTEWFYDLRPRSADLRTVDGILLHPGAGQALDDLGVAPAVVFRSLPYFGWGFMETLPLHGQGSARFHDITTDEVTVEDLGHSGAERFTLFAARVPFWQATSTALTYGRADGRLPLFDVDETATAYEVARHGARTLELEDGLAPLTAGGEGVGSPTTPVDWIVERAKASYLIHSQLPKMLSGTLDLATLRPEIRIGEFVRYRGLRFYAHGVAHNVEVDENGAITARTTLTVTRGQPNSIADLHTLPTAAPGWTRTPTRKP